MEKKNLKNKKLKITKKKKKITKKLQLQKIIKKSI